MSQGKEYQHKEQHWGQYRSFENQQEKDYNLRSGGFTTDDRITGFNDVLYEPSPSPPKPIPKPKKINPNLFGFHPKVLQQTEEEFVVEYNDDDNNNNNNKKNDDDDDDDKNSLISSNSSINRVTKTFGNTRNDPKYFVDNRHSLQSVPDIDEISIKHKIIGVLCIMVAVICWVSLGHIVKHIQSDYDKPYFLSYCITSGLFGLIIIWLIMYCYDNYIDSTQQFTQNAFKNDTTYTKQEILYKQDIALWKRLIFPSLIFSVLIICCNYFWVISLNKTMVSVNTTIYQTNVAIIYVLSIFLLNNRLTLQKNIGFLLCGIGVVIVLFGAYKEEDEHQHNNNNKNEVSGIIQCIISIICYSINAVLLKMTANKYFNDKNQMKDMLLLQSMTGFIGLILLWIPIIPLNAVDIETFKLPQTNNDILSLILSIILNLLFFISFSFAIILTNPVIASMGCLFVLPVGYFSDIIIHDYKVQIWAILGTIAIAFGFLLLNLPICHFIKSKINRKNSY